jgi:hypothetical protein
MELNRTGNSLQVKRTQRPGRNTRKLGELPTAQRIHAQRPALGFDAGGNVHRPAYHGKIQPLVPTDVAIAGRADVKPDAMGKLGLAACQ